MESRIDFLLLPLLLIEWTSLGPAMARMSLWSSSVSAEETASAPSARSRALPERRFPHIISWCCCTAAADRPEPREAAISVQQPCVPIFEISPRSFASSSLLHRGCLEVVFRWRLVGLSFSSPSLPKLMLSEPTLLEGGSSHMTSAGATCTCAPTLPNCAITSPWWPLAAASRGMLSAMGITFGSVSMLPSAEMKPMPSPGRPPCISRTVSILASTFSCC
mmetsp:Transcript_36608/g.121233  ORF Transcript_36608/g.121233 Transcript_36608/m.121233 type:complete len:220 (+) Transcript_36608:1114-1773(+)